MITANGKTLFSHAELCSTTGVVQLATGFADRLLALRLAFGRPMTVTSCCRERDQNALIGGHPRSLHLMQSAHGLAGTAAIDVRVPAEDRGPLFILAWDRGWSVGVGLEFLHLDLRCLANLPQRLFGY